MADKYRSFEELARSERIGVDYRIDFADRASNVLIIAPHGGWIEPTTSEIARAVAGNDLSFYLFEGLAPERPHADLHITSETFDEPTAAGLLDHADMAVGIHGMKDNDAGQDVWVGGRHVALRDKVTAALRGRGFNTAARLPGQTLAGWGQNNVCNRGNRREGIQVEISRTLRDRLRGDRDLLEHFAGAIRSCIA